jgi:hypothetical protein
MADTYLSAMVLCPFYMNDGKLFVKCEATLPTSRSSSHTFRSCKLKTQYIKSYCCKDYKKCRAYAAIIKKYEE